MQNGHKDDTDVSSRSERNHARRHLDSTTAHLYADKTLDLAGAGLNGWQQGQRTGVQAINVSLGAWHVEFAWVVAYSPLVGRKPPRCQQLAEPDSPTFSAQWFTDAGGADTL